MLVLTGPACEETMGAGFLVKRVGASAPVGEDHGQADGLEQLGEGADADVLDWPLLGEQLSEELGEQTTVSFFRYMMKGGEPRQRGVGKLTVGPLVAAKIRPPR